MTVINLAHNYYYFLVLLSMSQSIAKNWPLIALLDFDGKFLISSLHQPLKLQLETEIHNIKLLKLLEEIVGCFLF